MLIVIIQIPFDTSTDTECRYSMERRSKKAKKSRSGEVSRVNRPPYAHAPLEGFRHTRRRLEDHCCRRKNSPRHVWTAHGTKSKASSSSVTSTRTLTRTRTLRHSRLRTGPFIFIWPFEVLELTEHLLPLRGKSRPRGSRQDAAKEGSRPAEEKEGDGR
jgi:hypothetical protein